MTCVDICMYKRKRKKEKERKSKKEKGGLLGGLIYICINKKKHI